MFCRKCGCKLLPDDSFCPVCGVKLADNLLYEQCNNEDNSYADDHLLKENVQKNHSRKKLIIILSCVGVCVLFIALALIIMFNCFKTSKTSLTEKSYDIQGVWLTDDNNISLDFKSDGTIDTPDVFNFIEAVSNNFNGEYIATLLKNVINNTVDFTYSLDKEDNLNIDLTVSIVKFKNQTSQTFIWSEEIGVDKWHIDGDVMYLGNLKLTKKQDKTN